MSLCFAVALNWLNFLSSEGKTSIQISVSGRCWVVLWFCCVLPVKLQDGTWSSALPVQFIAQHNTPFWYIVTAFVWSCDRVRLDPLWRHVDCGGDSDVVKGSRIFRGNTEHGRIWCTSRRNVQVLPPHSRGLAVIRFVTNAGDPKLDNTNKLVILSLSDRASSW